MFGKFFTTILPFWHSPIFFFFVFCTPKLTVSQWSHLGRRSCKSRKKIRAKKQVSKIWFLDHKFFLCKESCQYPNVNSHLFCLIIKKRVGSFSHQYCCLAQCNKWFFFYLGPKNCLFPSEAIWVDVCEKWITYIQIVTHPYLAWLSKNVLEIFHNDIAVLARCNKCIFRFETPKFTDSQWGYLGRKINDWLFDCLAKWWRNGVDRFEFQSQDNLLGQKNHVPKFVFCSVKMFG